jgi:hypothetical protein
MVSPQARRGQLAFARARGLSQRQACGLLAISRSALSYELRLPAKDAPVIEAMRRCRRSIRATAIDASASFFDGKVTN